MSKTEGTTPAPDGATTRANQCEVHPWCNLGAEPHGQYGHSGDVVNLGYERADAEEWAGFQCWPEQEPGQRYSIRLVGRISDGDNPIGVTIPVHDLMVVMAATSTPEARALLVELLVDVDESEAG